MYIFKIGSFNSQLAVIYQLNCKSEINQKTKNNIITDFYINSALFA